MGRLALVAASSAAVVLSGASLAAGADWLETPVLFGVPAGNLLAWSVAFFIPLSAWLILPKGAHRLVARFMLVLAVLGALWLPASILLAGNVHLNYPGGRRFAAWLVYSFACTMLPLLLLAAWAAGRLLVRLRARFRSG